MDRYKGRLYFFDGHYQDMEIPGEVENGLILVPESITLHEFGAYFELTQHKMNDIFIYKEKLKTPQKIPYRSWLH